MFFNKIQSYYFKKKDFETKRRIVVFESDDWGTIRMLSKESNEILKRGGIRIEEDAFCKFDTIESIEDIENLVEILSKFKDINNRNPQITSNFILTNPDFEKIRNANFEEYYFENFYESYERYRNQDVLKTFLNASKGGFIYPQFHGREHVNVNLWMNNLKNNLQETKLAFSQNVFGVSTNISNENRTSYMETFAYHNSIEKVTIEENIKHGANMFYNVFGFKSKSIISPNFVWHPELENTFNDIGVKYIQGTRFQNFYQKSIREKRANYTGKINSFNQKYLIRNCIFEPSTYKIRENALDDCLLKVNQAFKNHNAAIISTHRINFVSGMDKKNAEINLSLFQKLLFKLQQKWPNIEFMNTVEFGNLL
jgi:hypothetical protein